MGLPCFCFPTLDSRISKRSLTVKLFAKSAVIPALMLSLTLCGGLRAHADNIAEVAEKNGHFKTLLSLVKAAGLTDALTGPGPLTVFAPTDAAFAKVPKATVAMLSKPENKEKLADLLKYHIVSGKVAAADVLKMKSPSFVDSLAGPKIKVTHTSKGVMVNQAKVVTPDVAADNGVIHVIDAVIMPPAAKSNKMSSSKTSGSSKMEIMDNGRVKL